jgi:hypothetical protein
LLILLKSISIADITEEMKHSEGFDGAICSLSFGSANTQITYQVWSPDLNTRERRLEDYLKACEYIIKSAHLQPEEIW